jgi:hypothetical protein
VKLTFVIMLEILCEADFLYIMLEILCEADFCIHNAGNIM